MAACGLVWLQNVASGSCLCSCGSQKIYSRSTLRGQVQKGRKFLWVIDLALSGKDNKQMIERNGEMIVRARRKNGLARLQRYGSLAIVAAMTISGLAGVAANPPGISDASAHGTPGASAVAALHRWFETGKASWYGLKLQGHTTATGEPFDMNDLTCAHRSAPLGSWLRVTNLRNHRSVLVRVNDRGPMVGDRIVDLSYAAARAVGLTGIGRVRLEVASAPLLPLPGSLMGMVQSQLKLPSLPVGAV